MKKNSLFFSFILGFLAITFLFPNKEAKSQGTDYVADAVAALQTSNVYVAPNTEGTDYNTAVELQKFLNESDRIVLVMLPSEAINETDMYSIAQKISFELNNQKTIGLAAGDELIGFSSILPEGVASDKMSRASSVSNDPITALITFTQNIHSWQSKYPQPTVTPTPEPTPTPRPTMEPIELPKIDTSTTSGKVSVGFIGVIVTIFAILLIVKLIPLLKRIGKFQPAIIMLKTIEKLLGQIEHSRVRTELGKACKLASGLIDIYKSSIKYTGIGEDLFLVLLDNIIKQLNALIAHEAYNKIISEDQYDQMIRTLLNYDDLFRKLQENDPEAIELMAANIMSENAMISHLGYLPTQK